MRLDIEEIARLVVDCGYHLHQNLGPGLLESAYEAILTGPADQARHPCGASETDPDSL